MHERNGHRPAGRPDRAAMLALVAHDAKKHDLLRLLRTHRELLEGVDLVATGTTGTLLSTELDLRIQRLASGASGGDLQIGAMVADGRVDAVVFLRDPLTSHPHEPDPHVLLRVCDVRQVPLATNLASAEMLLHAVADAGVAPPAPCAPFAGSVRAEARNHPVGSGRRLLRPVPTSRVPDGG
jgi:methylglyoxal synthase